MYYGTILSNNIFLYVGRKNLVKIISVCGHVGIKLFYSDNLHLFVLVKRSHALSHRYNCTPEGFINMSKNFTGRKQKTEEGFFGETSIEMLPSFFTHKVWSLMSYKKKGDNIVRLKNFSAFFLAVKELKEFFDQYFLERLLFATSGAAKVMRLPSLDIVCDE
uniref:Uncharacterized protein n=1 Tax=Rhizophagus irregularis (strain DAOM 181602 / DAOM 197198 / MUCL 43194) TaxID=747089 RepID=U9U0W7_RHIID